RRRGGGARLRRRPGTRRPAGGLDDPGRGPIHTARSRGGPARRPLHRRYALMAMFERADTDKRVTWLTLVGLVLVPILIAAGFVFATWQAGDRLDQVTAASVNNDEGAEIDGQQVPLGRQLSSGLVDSDQQQDVTWVLPGEDEAEAGHSDGPYAASVTVPQALYGPVDAGRSE